MLVERQPVPSELSGKVSSRAFDLERRLNQEFARHRGATGEAFSIVVKGPVAVSSDAPSVADQDLWGLVRHSYALWRWTRASDDSASVERRAYDSRIYLVVQPAESGRPAFVEGESEDGGRVGVACADLRPKPWPSFGSDP